MHMHAIKAATRTYFMSSLLTVHRDLKRHGLFWLQGVMCCGVAAPW